MIRINARSLLAFDSIALWDILTGKFTLVFDDGELEVTARETLYSFYAWNLHREYPNTPLLKKHHVKTVIGDKRLGSNTHLELLGNCAWSVYDTYINYLPAYQVLSLRCKTIHRTAYLRHRLESEVE